MTKNNVIKWTIMTGLWAVLLIPFFVANTMFFPYISGKNFAFRIIVEIIFALWVYLAFIDAKYRPKFSWVAVAVGAFVFIMALADIFAVNPMKAIWSNFERMDGFVTLAHLLMYLFVFGTVMKTEKNWLWFFRSAIISPFIYVIYEFFLYLKNSPSTDFLKFMGLSDRWAGPTGNPIYLAVFFMFLFFFALILLYKDVIANESGKKTKTLTLQDGVYIDEATLKSIFSNWLTYAYSLFAAFAFFVIWMTSTRGVILGLIGGLIVTSIIIAIFEKKNKLIKNSSIGLLVAIVLLIGGFLSVKNTEFVQKNATLKRLADISWTQVAGQGQARQYVWPMAIKGFMERPILGWGQDGFNNIFNKYYDVRMYNQEQWFDRAHNTPLDILVAGGALGLLSYLAIFIAALLVIIKKKNNFGVTEGALIVGLLAAYFAQNLFVFDNVISYMFFFVVLSYLYSRDMKDSSKDERVVNGDIANYVVLPIMLVILIVTLWYANIKPIIANKNLIISLQALQQSPETSLAYFKKVFAAKTFGSSEAREQIISMAPQVSGMPTLDAKIKQEFVDLAYTQMQEQLVQTPKDARYHFFMGVFLDNMNQYQLALDHLEKAVEFSPNKLTMMIELAKCYSYLGQKDKALEVAKSAYDLMPEYSEVKMSYVAALIVNGKEAQAKQLIATSTVNSESVVRAYLIRASDLIKKGDKNAAVAEIRKAIALAPGFKTQGESIIKGILDGSIK